MEIGMKRREILKYGAALGGSSLVSALSSLQLQAQTLTSVKFATDFTYQGNHAIWGLGIARGLFKEQGLNVTMDRGFGSGDTIVKVASGAYDFGFADINAVVKFNAQNPGRRVLAVLQGFDRTLSSIITLKKNGISAPQGLMGRKMASPEGDASRLMFPAFARVNGIDAGRVSWTSVSGDLRESVLVSNQVDAITGFTSTSIFNLIRIGIKREDIVAFPYASYGLNLYGNAVIVREEYLQKNPEIVRAFVKATINGTLALIKDPQAGMAAMKQREPLFDTDLEAQRLQLVFDEAILTPAVKSNGIGFVDPARIALTIKVNAEAYGISDPPTPEQLYTDQFLPPKNERMIPA
jgi:NitT/TauT family transport system substrate-binding protein